MPQRVNPQQIARMARARGLDPRAVLAVAAQEGLGGGVGDHGTSFGPFQLHKGGAYPSAAPQDPQRAQAWSWSPGGIAYALRQIASVAGGQRGAQAVRSIVSGFERPADPGREIQGALGAYGHGAGGTMTPAATGVAPDSGPAYPARAAPPVNNRRELALALLGQVGQANPDYSSVFQLLNARTSTGPGQVGRRVAPPETVSPAGLSAERRGAGRPGPVDAPQMSGQLGGLNPGFEHELEQAASAAGATRVRVDSGYRSPEHNAAVGGVPRSNHTTGHAVDGSAYVPGKGWVPLGVLLQQTGPRFGLRSGNVPGFYHGGRDPVHVDDGSNVRRKR